MSFLSRVEAFYGRKTELLNLSLFLCLFTGALLLMIAYNWPGQTQFLFLRNPTYTAPDAFGFIPVPTLDPHSAIAAGAGFVLFLFLSFLGIRTRICLTLAFVCYFLYFGQLIDYTFVRRKTNLIPLVLLVLMVSPSINECGLIPARRQRDPKMAEEWPLFLVKGLVAVVYLLFGYTKLYKAGMSFAWASGGSSLQAYLLTFYLYGDMQYALWLARHPLFCEIMSWFTLVFEFSFWIILVWPRLTFYFVVAGLFFHSGIAWFMEIYYIKYFGLTYVVFFDLNFFRTVRGYWLRLKHGPAPLVEPEAVESGAGGL